MASTACIGVLAGTNGSGKSSIGGAFLRQAGHDYFNPDEVTAAKLRQNPHLSREEANSRAWLLGKELLERAIEERLDFDFETTLGGRTIVALLEKALDRGLEVRIWYVGLESPELNIQRVRARVRKGGHDIPEEKIRERFISSVSNLARLLPRATEIRVFDNSFEAEPSWSEPQPRLLLHTASGSAIFVADDLPAWVAALVAAAKG